MPTEPTPPAQLPAGLTIKGRRPYLRDYGGGYLRIVDTPDFDVRTQWLGGDGDWHNTLECPKPSSWPPEAAAEFIYLHADLPEIVGRVPRMVCEGETYQLSSGDDWLNIDASTGKPLWLKETADVWPTAREAYLACIAAARKTKRRG